MPRRSDLANTYCPVGRAAELVGDRAVLLILRDMFFGVKRFEEFQANTGLGPQILSARLKAMEQAGVIERQLYSERPTRHEYRLTAKGKDLFDVLYAMRNWAERWAYDPAEASPAMRYIHRDCGTDVGLATTCPGCGEALGYGSLKGEMSAQLKAERAARGAA